MSTFEQTCPLCKAVTSAAAVLCDCGYVFNSLYSEDPQRALSMAVREEQLIEEYLCARVEQAAEFARRAVRTALRHPEDEGKLIDATQAQRAARAARTELARQRLRSVEAQTRFKAYAARAFAAGNAASTDALTDAALPTTSWQATIVCEALKAESARALVAASSGPRPARPRKKPGPAFRAMQAAKADSAVRDVSTTDVPTPASALRKAADLVERLTAKWPGRTR